MNFVKVISSELDKVKRRIIKVLRFGRSDVRTSLEASPHGIDSVPVKDLIAIYSETGQDGDTVIIGYLNKNRLAEVGENRLFSTDENGVLSTFIWLKNDGTMEVGGDTDFMVRFSELETGFNQLKSDLNSLISTFNTHVHPGVTVGAASTLITVTLETPSNADISNAKIQEIKTI